MCHWMSISQDSGIVSYGYWRALRFICSMMSGGFMVSFSHARLDVVGVTVVRSTSWCDERASVGCRHSYVTDVIRQESNILGSPNITFNKRCRNESSL